MTHLLKQAFDKISQLPDEDQDTIAALLLAEIESERNWDKAFEESRNELAQLAEEALREHRAGKSKPLD